MTNKLYEPEHRIRAGTPGVPDVSFDSAGLINGFFESIPANVQLYMESFRKRFGWRDVSDLLDRMKALKVVVVGDTILDDYCFCRTLGTSSKDPALAVHCESNEMFAGGVLAVANHLANFSDHVSLVTVLGERDSHRDFIESKLNAHVERRFVVQDGAPTTIKRRFVDGYFVSKLFEVYAMDDSGLSPRKEELLTELLTDQAGGADLVVVADFGHGAISPRTREHLTELAPFLAVNTQANAGNRGFHTIGSYERADYVSLSEGEIRLERRNPRGEVIEMITALAERMGTGNFMVTRGQKGCLVHQRGGRLVRVPSFTPKVVDRVGAGDALFSITSLAARLDAPPEVVGLLGNVVGGLAVEVLGNRKSIDRAGVEGVLRPLLT
jgi:bifunctional ADP-heptose synthase (sugar kinase/adenylyltransferase)